MMMMIMMITILMVMKGAEGNQEAELVGSIYDDTRSHWRIRQLRATFQHCVRHHCPLVIHGPPGSGRTSMTAAVCQFCRSWLSSPHAVVVARVLASSPASMTIEYVLSTVCYQIAEVRTCSSVSRSVKACPHFFPKQETLFPETGDFVAVLGDFIVRNGKFVSGNR